MSTKHEPATPLPWKPSMEDGNEQDAAYIAHAANSYPRLVEALRSLHDAYGKDSKSKAAALVGARHLLRELGEE